MMKRGNVEKNERLTLVIPVYCEQRRLKSTLEAVVAFIRETKDIVVDAVFVDDGSSDDCSGVIRAFIASQACEQIRLIRLTRNQGKGYAVKTGILAAEGDLILMSDTDLSTPLKDWRKLKVAIDAGADIACGSRALAGAHIGIPPPLHRRILSKIFNRLVRLAGVRGFRDTQCGFKLFRAKAAQTLFRQMRLKRFAFDVEMIARACDWGYHVVEIPVNWDYSGHSTVRVFSSGGRMLLDVLLLAVRRVLFGKAHPIAEDQKIEP